ncbi:T9SS type A sorting domain-containing protein [Rhodohalobacter barkolensis]|uniref:Secretion system C-terminal sorting domain-containing protein n=1 Tax=Rhodohalobacter barkolensis TaxID=2053187 RepID=A0A2N0VKP6_9BACT|nr:T9SS type A sorting domain-containing protein [Rhodohalobacter barkolensis]PKD44739.1 hypothetical protein CWD77_04545 [Rhodohalobacter barkolensis]
MKQLTTFIKGIFLLLIIPINLYSQTVTLNSDLSSEVLLPEDELVLTISVNDAADVFFFSVEVEFDENVLEFQSIENVGLTSGGLKIAELLDSGLLGSSVSRTSPLSTISAGDIMQLTFSVKTKTTVGNHTFSFNNQNLTDSSDQIITTDPLDDITFEVEEAITDLALTTPSLIELTEGDTYLATSEVYANGVSQDISNSDRLNVWVGVNEVDSDPSDWDESVWEQMTIIEEDEGYFLYEAEIAYQRPLGSYYVAVRSELDTQPGYKYGGVGGFWNSLDYPSAEMIISEQAPFRYTLVEYNFDEEIMNPSFSLPQNDGIPLEIVGASLSGFISGASGQAANSNGWDNYDETLPKYWEISISTENFENILLSSKQSGSGTGPRDFQLQVSVDGVDWVDVAGGEIIVGENWTSGVLDQLQLPSIANNQEQLFIRWLNTSEFRIDEEASDPETSSGGTCRIDDIIISGVNPDAERVEVWPGDTDNDGFVNESDVLPLTAYWRSVGPEPPYQFRNWDARGVEAWIPVEATYADANGDGIVNQNDLLPIGLNFGESRTGTKQPDGIALSTVTAKNMKAGEEMDLYIMSDDEILLTGFSFRFSINGIAESDWQVQQLSVGDWGKEWESDNRLIDFNAKSDFGLSAAVAHRGFTQPKKGDNLIKITLRAVQDWVSSPEIVLERASIVAGRDVHTTDDVYLSFDETGSIVEPGPTTPERTELLPNFPNPFNPSTTIQYKLSNDSNVKIDVYNSLGRRVATILDQNQQAGEYDVTFNADNFSSGIYFYRLQTSDYVRTRSMVLIK